VTTWLSKPVAKKPKPPHVWPRQSLKRMMMLSVAMFSTTSLTTMKAAIKPRLIS
jgi:Na+-transporting NADH:ubiquinone oxidoreductase subunit NqrB